MCGTDVETGRVGLVLSNNFVSNPFWDFTLREKCHNIQQVGAFSISLTDKKKI